MVQTRSSLRRRQADSQTDPSDDNAEIADNTNMNNMSNNNSQTGSDNYRMYVRSRRRKPRWLPMLEMDRRALEGWRRPGLAFLVALSVTIALAQSIYNPLASITSAHSLYSSDSKAGSRHLLSGGEDGPAWESCDFELETSKYGWVVSHLICILIIFIALAVVCDDFFVPSLEAISDKLHLSEDVAGATFMAAGSSAPELFTSVAGVAVRTDVGVGTIVGSAVFNILIIIALTAALAGQVLHLDWRPLMRDSFFYAMSIGCFIGFSWDGWFTHYEAAVLLVLYGLYICLMVFNPRLMDWMGTWKFCCCSTSVKPAGDEEGGGKATPDSPDIPTTETHIGTSNPNLKQQGNGERKISMAGGHARRLSLISQKSADHGDRSIFHHHQRGSLVSALTHPHKKSLTPSDEPIKEEELNPDGTAEEPERIQSMLDTIPEDEDDTIQLCPCLPCCPAVRTYPPSKEQARAQGGCWAWTKFVLKWIIFIPAFPFVMLFSWTIPDCSKDHNKKWFLVSFFMSVTWIALLSFTMVTLVSRTGCILKIDSYTMGLVIIAIGTSIPDALSSILVARDGYGDMAVSNAIGSNVFDINLGLGLPFVIRIAIDKGAPISLMSEDQWIDYWEGLVPIMPHAKFGFILLVILILALAVFGFSKFRLTKLIGISFVILYVLFLTYAFIQELYCARALHFYC